MKILVIYTSNFNNRTEVAGAAISYEKKNQNIITFAIVYSYRYKIHRYKIHKSFYKKNLRGIAISFFNSNSNFTFSNFNISNA